MDSFSIRGLVWDLGNVAHIARHRVVISEVEGLCHGTPEVWVTYAHRLRLVGPTRNGRMLTAILEPLEDRLYRVVTARPASRKEGKHMKKERVRQLAKPTRIPKFKTREEEAEFWDTHDTADFEAEFTPVRALFAKNLSQGMTIRFDAKTLEQLRSQAAEQGMGPTTLARSWILERLKKQPRVKAKKTRS